MRIQTCDGVTLGQPVKGIVAAWTLAVVLAVAPAKADSVDLGASRDNTLYEADDAGSAMSNGAGDYLFAGLTGEPKIRRAVIAFDVAGAIPAGSTITSATLKLRVSRSVKAGNVAVAVHRLSADWGEGGSEASGEEGMGASPQTNDATWFHRFYSPTFWVFPGGDYSAGASATTAVGEEGVVYQWTSAQLTADVQAFLDSPGTNYGWIVIADESAAKDTAKRFDSKDNNDANHRPKLTVVYTPPTGTATATPTPTPWATATSTPTPSTTPTPSATPTATAIVGACCLVGGCQELSAAQCSAQGGAYQGDGTLCSEILCPLEPYVDPLPLPAIAQPVAGSPGGEATYVIPIVEFEQKLHRDLPPTRLWGYGGTYPGPSIEAFHDLPVTVTWVNDLRDFDTDLPRTEHILPVDECLHGPDTEGPTPRTVVHLHGGHVPHDSDGYPEDTFLPGQQDTYVYPNNQLPATLWYHDHALGITRLNVYMGMAGFYLLRDQQEIDLGLPSGPYEVALAIQDRSFLPDGSLAYPTTWQEHVHGDYNLVNGKVWPYLEVARGLYRFRVLAGANSRTYRLSLSNGATFLVIGSEGGLLPAPVPLTEITLQPGERADLLVDFGSELPGTEILLQNSAPAPFPGSPGFGVVPQVMKFVVTSAIGHTTPPPATLRPLETLDAGDATVERELLLRKLAEPCAGTWWTIDGLHWDHVTELPALGATEIWSFANRSGISHPMHMHLSMFQVLDRQPFTLVGDVVTPTGTPEPPEAWEVGWKDTVQVPPDTITRLIVRFEDYTGLFAYHCHILEHEDHEMMRQFEVTAPPALDIDGDGTAQALTDGLLLLRYLFGFRGSTLVSGVIDPDCTRCDAASVGAWIEAHAPYFDFDDDGTLQALTDGVLAVRYLFGFRGTTLTNGVVGAACERCTGAAIAGYSSGILP